MASRSCTLAMTSAGAFAVKARLPSLAAVASRSFSAAASARVSRDRSAATSMAPDRSTSTTTPPAVVSEAVTVKPAPASSMRSNDLIAASPEPAPASRAGTRWAALTPWSARKRRTSVTTACTSAISCSAATFARPVSATGHGAMTTDSPPVSAVHSVSVTNGIIGCSSRSRLSSTSPSTR